MMIGFAAGGGADTQARLVAQGLEAKYGWKVLPQQVDGNSGLNLVAELVNAPTDGTAIGMVVSESLTYSMMAAGNPDLQIDKFTALATTASFQTGLVAMAEGNFNTWDKVAAAAKAGEQIRFGTASDRQADVAYLFGKAAGIDFNIVPVKGGAGVMNGLRGGDLDIGWVAGAQSKPVTQGEMVNIASAIPAKLKDSPDAPLVTDLGSKYVLDGYFMFVAPGNMDPEARKALGDAIRDVLNDPTTEANGLVTKVFGGPDVITGEALDAKMSEMNTAAATMLKDAESN
ncbi:tripartite tricarboxylate transporter substrate-binding protein [Pseudooceanicola sp. 216_PA32_1]|uniref:Tripartite tricarboxylate transporter substrate-binding protein n=2 Tax=Pseudooceanicola pacificus TaxID=2676438 RepID=A0A844WFG6_9RHOB|nr:tripartite tricarboxylate transporter substrate-binding protein [Pseudooceanicola pacificus]